jgi:hypothetical protein
MECDSIVPFCKTTSIIVDEALNRILSMLVIALDTVPVFLFIFCCVCAAAEKLKNSRR